MENKKGWEWLTQTNTSLPAIKWCSKCNLVLRWPSLLDSFGGASTSFLWHRRLVALLHLSKWRRPSVCGVVVLLPCSSLAEALARLQWRHWSSCFGKVFQNLYLVAEWALITAAHLNFLNKSTLQILYSNSLKTRVTVNHSTLSKLGRTMEKM